MQRFITSRKERQEYTVNSRRVREYSCFRRVWSKLKQKVIQVRVFDNSFEKFRVTRKTTALDVCRRLVGEKFGPAAFGWAIVEVWRDEKIERLIENHESLLQIYRDHIMGHGNKRYLMFRSKHPMFDMFTSPQDYTALYSTYDISHMKRLEQSKRVIEGEVGPLYYTRVWVLDGKKKSPTWERKVLLIKGKRLYLAPNFQSILTMIQKYNKNRLLKFKSKSLTKKNKHPLDELEYWTSLSDCKVFICSNTNKTTESAPYKFCLCLVSDSGIKQYIACEHNSHLINWMCAMRLSKYGKQLRDNYRSFVKKQSDPNEHEYNKRPMPNESIRSHVAMDFRGNVGRIVEDPVEAQAIAQAELGSTRRINRNNSRSTPGLQSAITRLDINIHLSQPWYHQNLSREQAAFILNRLEEKDGVFLIRESKKNIGSYVLSFKCNGKIIHTPIMSHKDSSNGQLTFSLDGGQTKFYDLLQLVEFHQLNSCSLPTRLMHYVIQVPTTE